MILNPILMLILAGLSLLVGTAIPSETADWLCGIPFAIFIFLFCLSLMVPVVKKAQLVAGCRVAFKVIKLTAHWLSAVGHYGARYLAQKRFEMVQARRPKPIVGG